MLLCLTKLKFQVSSLFICHKKYLQEKKKKSNYLDSHGEEAQKKPAGL